MTETISCLHSQKETKSSPAAHVNDKEAESSKGEQRTGLK